MCLSLLYPADLIYQWKELHALATERCQQAQQLSYTTEVIAEVKKLQDGVGQYLTLETFKSMEELEAVISELRVITIKNFFSYYSFKSRVE